MPELSTYFQPVQLGFGTRGGCEAAVHAARTYIAHGAGEVLLKVDVKNAFNSVDRAALLTQVKDKVPAIYNYIWQCYNRPSKLLYKQNLISSCIGCQQGDPLGPAIFSLAIHPYIESLASKFNVWYLDDGTMGGEATTVLSDLQNLKSSFSSIGLDFNFDKCELYINNYLSQESKFKIIKQFNNIAPNITILGNDSLRLLGAPLNENSVSGFVIDKISKFNDATERLEAINPHLAYIIIKYCLFVPKFTYFLRCCDVWRHISILEDLDNILRVTLSKILNCKFDDNSWTQASLPVRYGGLGVRKASDVALPAFLSSCHSTADLFKQIVSPSMGEVHVSGLDDAKIAWFSLFGPSITTPTKPASQRSWDDALCKRIQLNLLNSASDLAHRARLMAAAEPESGYWLNALPSEAVGTLLDRTTFCLGVCLRIGSQINEIHRCRCGVQVDLLGHHGLSCPRSAGRLPRHAAINDIIRRALVSVRVPAVLEPAGLLRDDGKRPDGMTLLPWKNGRALIWDATCVDTLAPCHLSISARQTGSAAANAESLKRRKYSTLLNDYLFVPFAVETLGPWGNEARQFYKHISARLVEVCGDPRAGSYLGQRISLAIQRGNAASILGTLPFSDSDEFHEIYRL